MGTILQRWTKTLAYLLHTYRWYVQKAGYKVKVLSRIRPEMNFSEKVNSN